MSQYFSKEKKNKEKKQIKRQESCLMSWNFHRAHPAPVEHSTPLDQKMLLKKEACKASPLSLCLAAVTCLCLVRAMVTLSVTVSALSHKPGAVTKR